MDCIELASHLLVVVLAYSMGKGEVECIAFLCPKIRRKTAKKEKFESPLLNSKITRNQLVSGKLYEFPYIFENSDVVSVLLSTIA